MRKKIFFLKNLATFFAHHCRLIVTLTAMSKKGRQFAGKKIIEG